MIFELLTITFGKFLKNGSYNGFEWVYLNIPSQYELGTALLINVCEGKMCFILIKLEHYICKMGLLLLKMLDIW